MGEKQTVMGIQSRDGSKAGEPKREIILRLIGQLLFHQFSFFPYDNTVMGARVWSI
jgi:hypothetical protein